ncbi:MAG TPA: hypothetical protein VFA09_00660 [Ktedonobacteraceae bacterium]|nr:hypothetical protein [Ktedonobacteraceae bacterium]
MINQNFVILGAIISSTGGITYVIATIKGRVKPNRVSFLLWSLAPLIAFVAELQQGVGIQSLMTFMVGFLPLTIFIASFVNKNARWKLTRFDLICGGLSVIGLLLWYITSSGNVAIIFSILADALAALPTIVKAFNFPETESAIPFFTGMISAVITLLTIKVWNLANVGFPLYILIVSLLIATLVQFKPGKVFRTYFP